MPQTFEKLTIYFEKQLEDQVYEVVRLLQSQIELKAFTSIDEINVAQKSRLFICVNNLDLLEGLSLGNQPIYIFSDIRSRKSLLEITLENNLQGLFLMNQLTQEVQEFFTNISDNFDSNTYENVKALNKFTQRVSKIASFNDLMDELKNEFKNIKKINPPILALDKSQSMVDLFFYQGAKVRVSSIKGKLEAGSRMRRNSLVDRSLLASALGRPVAKILAVPMLEGVHPITVFLEHDLSEKELNKLLNFISRILQVIETILDVLLIERKLNEASQLWEKTFEGINDPVAVIDGEYNLLRGNARFKSNTPSDKCYKIFVGEDHICSDCPIQKMKDAKVAEVGHVTVNGTSYEVHSSPIYLGEKDAVAGYANHYIDQTETLKLKSRIIQSEKMAAIGHLAGNIAHELNNPLTGVRSFAQLLISEVNSELEMAKDLIEVEKAASRCQKIITNLLEYTKGQQAGLRSISLKSVVKKTIPMLKSALRPYKLSVNLSEAEQNVEVNEQLIQQVLFNLLLNSTQAMPGTGEIVVSEGVQDEMAFIEVKDTGPGIPKEVQSQVFEPFFTTKAKGKGTGLGLSMVKKVVESYGGKIELSTQLERGTEIRVLLPIKEN